MPTVVCLGRALTLTLPLPLTRPPLAAAVRCAASGKRTVSSSPPSTRGRRSATAKSSGKKGGKRAEPVWQCASGCGACCKLAKGPAFPDPEDIFSDDPDNLKLYKSLVGPDGWCVHYEAGTRTCSIYDKRPTFCRVEPEVFEKLYGIKSWRFNKEACTACTDTIKAVYGSEAQELKKFKQLTRGR